MNDTGRQRSNYQSILTDSSSARDKSKSSATRYDIICRAGATAPQPGKCMTDGRLREPAFLLSMSDLSMLEERSNSEEIEIDLGRFIKSMHPNHRH